ncbi:MAG TPA: hypothetical protein VM848_00910 [Acidimicrobiia bacterium]|nr:hypothetical protein [Acidimicrobiia bacterium]
MARSTLGSTAAVHARGLTKLFADGVGVHDLSLNVEQGTFLASSARAAPARRPRSV